MDVLNTFTRSRLWLLGFFLVAGAALAGSDSGGPLTRGDLDGSALYGQVPAAGSPERQLMWRGRDCRYPTDQCLLCDRILPGKDHRGVDFVIDGVTVRLCGPACQKQAQELDQTGKQELVQRLNLAVVQRDLPEYPLTSSPVSGQKLSSPIDGVNQVFDNTLVRLANEAEVAEFLKDPCGYVLAVRLARTLAAQRCRPVPGESVHP